jgi:hypothetical protein
MGYVVVGLDLGKESDPTALAVVSVGGHDWHDHARLNLVHLERYPLGTPYTSVADRVSALVRNPHLFSPELVVDAGGVGGAVADILAAEGVRFVPVTLTGGQRARYEGGSWRVPKAELVAALDVALTTGRLKVAQGLPLWPALREELLAFRRKIDLKTAHVSFEHHTASGHGDLVIATALAVWKAAVR